MSHLGLGWQAWVWGTEPSRRPGRGPRLCPAGAHTCPAPPTQAAAGARLPAVPWFRSRDPPGPRTLAHPSPKGRLAAPLNTLLHPHWEATAANRGTDLPKVTKAGRAPSYLHGRVSAPSQLDAFGSRSLRGCLGDPGPAGRSRGTVAGWDSTRAPPPPSPPARELSDNRAPHTGRGRGRRRHPRAPPSSPSVSSPTPSSKQRK